ncbi:MAG: SHOCT domain-containing protein [Ignavibacteriales bacterium]
MMWSCPGVGYGGGFAGAAWMMAINGLFWAVLLVVLVAVATRATRYRHWRAASPGLAVLEERYARGEIGRDEYLEKRGDLAKRR